MRLVIEPTPEVGQFFVNGATVKGRIWLGTTERGSQLLVVVSSIAAGPLAVSELVEPPGTPEWETMLETGADMDELVKGRLVDAAYAWYQLFIDGHLLWIQPRAGYCDRGRYAANYHGRFFIDAADGFPRYYMDLETAKREMKAWLLHRMRLERRSA